MCPINTDCRDGIGTKSKPPPKPCPRPRSHLRFPLTCSECVVEASTISMECYDAPTRRHARQLQILPSFTLMSWELQEHQQIDQKIWSCMNCPRYERRCDKRHPCIPCTTKQIDCVFPVSSRVHVVVVTHLMASQRSRRPLSSWAVFGDWRPCLVTAALSRGHYGRNHAPGAIVTVVRLASSEISRPLISKLIKAKSPSQILALPAWDCNVALIY